MMKLQTISLLIALCSVNFAFSQFGYTVEDEATTMQLIDAAIEAGEFDPSVKTFVKEELDNLKESPKDLNRIYDYGRALQKGMQIGLKQEKPRYSDASESLLKSIENVYRHCISENEDFGRANIMLGMYYNQRQQYMRSAPYLEVGLELEEGSEDWMIAANQYLLAGAYTYNTEEPDYQEVYKKFKKHVANSSEPYYQKMVKLYAPYYEK